MRKILSFFIFLFVFSFFISPFRSFAASNFSTDYNVIYNIQVPADTNVNLNVILTNLTQSYYASSYDIEVGFTDIRNLSATDPGGKVDAKIKKTESGSIIEVPFNTKVVGLNEKLAFNISFNTAEIAQDLKNVWEVNIPGISSTNDFANFNVTVNYPSFLGKPEFIKPALSHALESSQNSIKFTRGDLGASGISLSFGSFQVYDFDLTYHLENTNLFTTRTEIALPLTTNYQDIAIKDISPKPDNVVIDEDGNWLAKYTLSASKKLNVKVKGQAKVFLNPKPVTLSNTDRAKYLKQDKFWETKNPKIIALAKELKTPRAIYDYAVKKLTYDFSRVETNSPRLGAVGALNNPDSAVCLEFTDLFIAIARAAGIPAREVNGYAYTDNSTQRPLSFIKDVLHAWPQYYDSEKNTWIMVDPTWGNTTKGVDYFDLLDFDHLAFVVNGVDSSYPVPAGGYKFSNQLDTKDVNVTISSSFTPKGFSLKPGLNVNTNLIAGIPIEGNIRITNTGDSVSTNKNAYVNTDYLSPRSQNIQTPNIPPFGYIDVNFSLDKTSLLTNTQDTIKITVANASSFKKVYIAPFFLSKWAFLGGIIIGSTILIISVTFIGYRRISLLRQRRANNLRGESGEPQEQSL